jgi:formylglycine-generating enzyme
MVSQLTHAARCRYRLPTEAEWEYVARGNTSTNSSYFWTGDQVPQAMQNNQQDSGMPKASLPTAVARFPPNSFGVHDTLGNVEEWVYDWHAPYAAAHAVDPVGPASGQARVTRGGSHR